MRVPIFAYTVLSLLPALVRGGANEPIADNLLGLTAKACAEKFCQSKNGLELWIALSPLCDSEATETAPWPSTSDGLENGTSQARVSARRLWDATTVGTASALASVAGFLAGFAAGIQGTLKDTTRRKWRRGSLGIS